MENNEQAKQEQGQGQKQLPFSMLEQVDADRALAVALQEQESAFTMLETIDNNVDGESDRDDDEDESSSSNDVDGNYGSQDFYELQFLGEDGDGDVDGSDTDEIEEDEIDPDDMSYEELIALGEIVGEESRGLSIDEIASSLSPYSPKLLHSKTIIDRCVICQFDYEKGEHLVALDCQHPFHFECINRWLQIKKVCPICSIEVTPSTPKKF